MDTRQFEEIVDHLSEPFDFKADRVVVLGDLRGVGDNIVGERLDHCPNPRQRTAQIM